MRPFANYNLPRLEAVEDTELSYTPEGWENLKQEATSILAKGIELGKLFKNRIYAISIGDALENLTAIQSLYDQLEKYQEALSKKRDRYDEVAYGNNVDREFKQIYVKIDKLHTEVMQLERKLYDFINIFDKDNEY